MSQRHLVDNETSTAAYVELVEVDAVRCASCHQLQNNPLRVEALTIITRNLHNQYLMSTGSKLIIRNTSKGTRWLRD
jgi:hypothetical protein